MKKFGHKRGFLVLGDDGEPTKGPDGKEIVEFRESPAKRETVKELGTAYGPDRERSLIVSLIDGDLIEIKPKGLTAKHAKQISAFDVYNYALRCEANVLNLERARLIKERKAERRAAERQTRFEKKWKESLK